MSCQLDNSRTYVPTGEHVNDNFESSQDKCWVVRYKHDGSTYWSKTGPGPAMIVSCNNRDTAILSIPTSLTQEKAILGLRIPDDYPWRAFSQTPLNLKPQRLE